MLVKCCRKCGLEFPASLDYFYKNAGGKYGLTPRCKSCVNEDNKEGHKRRMSLDPDKIRAQANERAKRSYRKNLEKNRERHREHQRKRRQDPEKREKIYARKRAGGAGLSPEQIQEIRDRQDNKCAICLSPEPTDLDHCHKTGSVRFLLCNHCNRGLGAFKDDPSLLRKAAERLEDFNDS